MRLSREADYYEVGYNTLNLKQAGGGQQSAGQTQLPGRPSLAACRPNPFRNGTSIGYQLPTAGNVSLQVYDVTGRTVRTLRNGFQKPGAYTATWNGRDERGREVPERRLLLPARHARIHRREEGGAGKVAADRSESRGAADQAAPRCCAICVSRVQESESDWALERIRAARRWRVRSRVRAGVRRGVRRARRASVTAGLTETRTRTLTLTGT